MINDYFMPAKMSLADMLGISEPETDDEPGRMADQPETEGAGVHEDYEEHYSDMRISCMAQILCLQSQKRLARSKAKKERLGIEIANLWELHKATYNPDFQEANNEGVNKY